MKIFLGWQLMLVVLAGEIASGDTSAVKAFTGQLKTGDIIFHQSQSRQAKAILEATGSPWSHVGVVIQKDGKGQKGKWFVVEAVQPVRVVPLQNFIDRGFEKQFRVLRLPTLTDHQRVGLRQELLKNVGTDYDRYFEWSDDLMYCSELVYKAYLKVTGFEIGVVQRYSELDLNGPYVLALILGRLTATGRKLNPEEPIVTPVSQMMDSDLELVIEHNGSRAAGN